jgi:hypothetical protein
MTTAQKPATPKSTQKSAHPRPQSTEKQVAPYHRGVLQLDRPMFLRQLCTDEYTPQPYTDADRRVVRRTQSALDVVSKDRHVPVTALAGERTATAAGLRALNDEYRATCGSDFYDVPDSATMGEDEAAEAFAGDELVVDVQTHFMAPHSMSLFPCDWLRDLLRQVMPPWWRDLDASHAWDLSTPRSRCSRRARARPICARCSTTRSTRPAPWSTTSPAPGGCSTTLWCTPRWTPSATR